MRSGKKVAEASNMKKNTLLRMQGKTIHLLRVKHARTLGERFKGLMGVSPHEHDYALVFHLDQKGILNASIHMFFMRMPIDVLFLNEKKQIVDIVQRLKPWTLHYSPSNPAKFVVELPAGTLGFLEKEKNTKNFRVNW